ncbi:hypothetical protein [Flammeovirga agarivorans]|uniref:Uncharacterized protein n=1 Tax=Flammeovirga agarivorans TaxID=2726742 RepID=A0A7X8SRN3_9BACT|nr:hypothetical protein [Flammeovirga agarivorans]NLR95160.1 hypothetical protein [Flammeovirga agarivorans]
MKVLFFLSLFYLYVSDPINLIVEGRIESFRKFSEYPIYDYFELYGYKLLRKTNFNLEKGSTVLVEKYSDDGRGSHFITWINKEQVIECEIIKKRITKIRKRKITIEEYASLNKIYNEEHLCKEGEIKVLPASIYLVTKYEADGSFKNYYCINN